MTIPGLTRRLRLAKGPNTAPAKSKPATAQAAAKKGDQVDLSGLSAQEARDTGKKAVVAGGLFGGLGIGTAMFFGAQALTVGLPVALGALTAVGVGLAAYTAVGYLKAAGNLFNHAAKQDAKSIPQQAPYVPQTQNLMGQEWNLSHGCG